MIITNIEKCAEPDTTLILRGVLKGYIKRPTIFMIKLKMTMSKIRKELPKKWPEDMANIVSVAISLYTLFKKKMDNDQALALVKTVMIPVALAKQMGLFRFVEEPSHTFENLITYQQRFKKEGPMRLNRMEIIEQSDKRYEFKVKNCVFKGAFTKFACPELMSVFCNIDNALYNLYMPDKVIFHRGGIGNTIGEGAEFCHFICENKEHKD